MLNQRVRRHVHLESQCHPTNTCMSATTVSILQCALTLWIMAAKPVDASTEPIMLL